MNFRAQFLHGAIWLAAIGCGMFVLLRHSYTPAHDTGAVPDEWPAQSSIPIGPNKPNLVMFIHPKCPCTSASLNELAIVMAHCQDRVSALVMIVSPPGASSDWANSRLCQSARKLPGVSVRIDDQGREARLFGANNSGMVVMYDAHGQLLYHGGITGARGHEGDNDGLSEVLQLLRGEAASQSSAPVFGCSLFSPDSTSANTNLCKQ